MYYLSEVVTSKSGGCVGAGGQMELIHVLVRMSGCEEIPLVQGKRNPSKTVGVARGLRGQTHWNHNHRKLVSLITWTTALSNSMKLSHALWSHPRRMGHGREVWQKVVHWRRELQTTSVFLPWEPHKQYEKAKW